MTQAYPLQWPTGWPRTSPAARKVASFNQKKDTGRAWRETVNVTIAAATDRLQRELDLMRAGYLTLSTNVELRLDGRPRSSGGAEPADPGVAVYFRLNGKDMVLACDRWHRVADNMVAIAKHIEALRGMDRWGVGTAAQAFAGYEALPAPEQWWQVLGLSPAASMEEIDAAWRAKMRDAHPDRGGTDAAAARLNKARDDGRRANG